MIAIAFNRFRATLALWMDVARARRALAQMDDHRLADLGLTRAQATVEAKRWFWDCAPRARARGERSETDVAEGEVGAAPAAWPAAARGPIHSRTPMTVARFTPAQAA